MPRFIHLLYVPTMNCNMQCKYCYLGEHTVELQSDKGYLETLQYAVNKLREADVVPFTISLHGGEVTTLSEENFRDLIAFIHNYYAEHRELLTANGFKIGRPHIKTNLLQLQKHLQTIRDFNVSISGSLDLPLSMHDACRITKGGQGTLQTILRNIELLRELPNHKKVSATIFKEHFDHLDEIVQDIRYLDENTCLDMNDFNFMIGFTPPVQGAMTLTALSEEDQVALYEKMKTEFSGTHLEKGFREAWFAEFTPAYCTNCDNCGEKFFLLEKNGDIYSCVRGQGNPDFYYGNIFRDPVKTIFDSARNKIYSAHCRQAFPSECGHCSYLHLCKTGCPYVKILNKSGKSYTCKLQQKIYQDAEYEPIPDNFAYEYLLKMHPELAEDYHTLNEQTELERLIEKDPKLQLVYSADAFLLSVDGQRYALQSQLLKSERDVLFLTPDNELKLYVKEEMMDALSDYPVNNALYMMLLSGDTVVYGDEQREKQAHVVTHQIFKPYLALEPSDLKGYYCVDLGGLLHLYGDKLSKTSPNNLFFTTTALRDYHYWKQKNNAFYHIQAINLPFQNIELFYFDHIEVTL